MNWGEIKLSINSTLGTNDFKPIDKLADDYARLVKLHFVVNNYTTANSRVTISGNKFRMNFSGEIGIQSSTATINGIEKNGTQTTAGGAPDYFYTYNVEAGDVVEVPNKTAVDIYAKPTFNLDLEG